MNDKVKNSYIMLL